MGFQIRRRTKGKSGWINGSWSRRNGIGISFTIKPTKNITHNFFGKRGTRTTINFGHGVKYVLYGKKPSSRPSPESTWRWSIFIFLIFISAVITATLSVSFVVILFQKLGWVGISIIVCTVACVMYLVRRYANLRLSKQRDGRDLRKEDVDK